MKEVHRRNSENWLSPEMLGICQELREETWFRLMISSSDPMHKRLAAALLLAGASDEMRRERQLEKEPSVKKARPPKFRISDEIVRAVRESKEMGKIVASHYGISESAVSLIRSGQRRA